MHELVFLIENGLIHKTCFPTALITKIIIKLRPILQLGGPGGAGTILATRAGRMLVDSRIGPHYDIVGFDPRGTLTLLARYPKVTYSCCTVRHWRYDVGDAAT